MATGSLPELGQIVQIPTFADFARGGVYFLYRNGEVVYVGQAADMRKRIGQHIAEGAKHFDSVSCIHCSDKQRIERERYYITLLAPPLNNCSVAKEAKGLSKLGCDMRVNAHSEPWVDHKTAAQLMGMSDKEFRNLPEKPEFKLFRLPRRNIKRKRYSVESIIALSERLRAA